VVSILETDSPIGDQIGYELYGQRVLISAPDASVGNPLTITFWVDQTRVPRNQQGQLILDLTKDGVHLPPCAAAGQANPNPCFSAAFGAGDDLVVTVLSTREQSRPSPPCPCAPIVTCPADIVRSTSNPGGIAVNFQPTAEDGCGRALAVTSTPASGSTFPQGTTRVTCEATGSGGAVTSCSFNVTVNCTDPTITCPANMAVETTSAAGAVVTFAPTARNGCSGALPVTSVPASGNIFPLGMTRVDCEATDPQGRKAACSLNVTVSCQG